MNNIQGSRQPNKDIKKKPDWYYATEKYAVPSLRKSIFQLLNSLIPYFILLAVIIFTFEKHYPYWITLLLGILAGGLLVRIFVLFHDCVHCSFFASRPLNKIVGWFCGLLACTPYDNWQWEHGQHHAGAGDLDRRGYGSVWMLTLNEYRNSPWYIKLAYRLYRNPLILFGIGPEIFFLIINRFPSKGSTARAKRSVFITDLILLVILAIAIYFLGFWDLVIMAAPVLVVATTTGVWLFYLQHQFPGVYWAPHNEWDIMMVALKGCSYYKLPKILQWFTANIGIHNIHHLRTAIPNYNLQKCYDQTPQMQELKSISLTQSLSAPRLKLWDEKNKTMISFGAAGSP